MTAIHWAATRALLFVAGVVGVCAAAGPRAAAAGTGADQSVTLPYTQPDKDGNQWMVYYYGYLQQQGQMPVYANAGVMTINGASMSGRMMRTAKLDGKTGELVLENLPIGGMSVTRRILFNKEDGYVRMIDLIRNTQGKDVQAQVVLNANSNMGIQSGQPVADPKKKGQNTAWLGTTQAGGKVMVEVMNGPGAKAPVSIDYQPGNSQVTGTIGVTVPANKEVALMHVHAVANNAADAQELLKKLKDNKLLKDVPAAVRKALVNFNPSGGMVGDFEILRGELFDVVETRGGDSFRGTLKDPSYKVATFYGPVEIPADRVISVISQGTVRGRQLVFTADGDVIGGQLSADQVGLELSDGQRMEIPLSQVARVGYRKRAGEPEEIAPATPYVLMRTGERVSIKPPSAPIAVHTRYGPMSLKAEALTAISFQNEEHAVHEVHLADGTRLAALVDSVLFEATLAGGEQTIKFPLSTAARIQFRPEPAEVEEGSPLLRLSNDETMVGTLTGKLKLDTGFSTLALDADGLKSLSRIKESPQDVHVTLWDETSFRGQLLEPEVTCRTKGGLEIRVPVALVEEYTQPAPKPSGPMVGQIRDLVGQLNADDWPARQKAQERLVGMGSAAAATLREMRPSQSEEAQSRIDQVLSALEKKGK